LQEISFDEGHGTASTVGGGRTFYYCYQTDHITPYRTDQTFSYFIMKIGTFPHR